jgi:hypothetical protein
MNERKPYVNLKILKNAAILISILFIADRTIGYQLKKIYFKQKKGDYYQTSYAINSAKQQLLIFGSSRASHHYVSSIFEKKVNQSTYNLGRDGRNVLYHEAIFSQVLTYHHPDKVILDVTPDEFTWKAGKEGQDVMVTALLPYIDQPLICKTIEKTNMNDLLLSKIFWTYAYNSIGMQVFGNYFGVLNSEQNIRGYEPLLGSKVSKALVIQKKDIGAPPKNDSTLVNSFRNFLALAKKNKITCYVVVSPIHQLGIPNCIPYLKQLTASYGYQFFDYSDRKAFKEPSLFYDDSHLNNTGAIIFSSALASQLKTAEKQNAHYR